MLTVTQAALYLSSQRGIKVKRDTLQHWCLRGLFPNATHDTDAVGRTYWVIPESDLLAFVPPTNGRPPAKKEEKE